MIRISDSAEFPPEHSHVLIHSRVSRVQKPNNRAPEPKSASKDLQWQILSSQAPIGSSGAAIKTLTPKATWGKKGVYFIVQLPGHTSSWRQVRAAAEAEILEEGCLQACWVARDLARAHLPQWVAHSHSNYQLSQYLSNTAIGQSGNSFPGDSRLCKVEK